MGFQIEDGKGTGSTVGVDSTNRLLVRNVAQDIFQSAAEFGDAYFFGTPLINLTSANPSAIFYLKNNEDFPLVLGTFFLIAESTTGGSPDMFRVNWYKNPTGMTISTAAPPLNQNFGSSKQLDANSQFGAEGSVVEPESGGTTLLTPVATLSFPIGVFNQIPANLILEKGTSFAIEIVPPAGNTGMEAQFGTRSILNTNIDG